MKRFNITSSVLSVAALSMLFASTASAQESRVPVPWENIVSADDTAVFWVLASFAVLLLILIWVVAGVTKGLLSDEDLWKEKLGTGAKAVAALIGTGLLLNSGTAMAESVEGSSPFFEMTDGLFWMMVIVDIFLVFVLLGMIYNLSSLIKSLKTAVDEEEVEESVAESIWTGSLSGAVALEEEKDILMDHEYDGIMELDNKLPPWWLYMFYVTIFFGVVYIFHFHISEIPGLDKVVLLGPVEKGTNAEVYLAEMQQAKEEKEQFLASAANNVDESNVELLADATALSNGKEKFETLCIACHAKSGGSTQVPPGVGPNLTDEYWIHGGGIKNIFKTIKYGVPAEGMISWESQLTPRQMQEVASYIISLEGSNPENAKDPQGEIWVKEASEEVAPAPADSTEQAPVAEVETADAAE